jgi:hypothetical protein
MHGMAGGWRAAALGAACTLVFPTIAMGQATKAGVVTTLQGTATVARATAAQPAPLKFKDDVFVQDHIVTGESSIVRILLGGKAVVTVRERSALTIHETPTTSTIEIGSGKIALAVAKARMKPGESVQIKTPNAMAGVRGTVVIADVAQAGGSVTTRFTLLTGIVDVARLDASTGQPAGQAVMLHPMETIAVTGSRPPGAVRAISRAEADSIAADYKVSLPPPPAAANTQVTAQQIELAVQHSAALTGAQPGPGDGGPGTAARTSNGDDGTGASNPTRTVNVGAGGIGGATLTGGGATAGVGVTAGGGSIVTGATLGTGGGGISVGGGISAGGGGISAGGGISIGGGSGIGAGGGGISVGGGVGVGGIGAGGGVTVGGGGIGVGGGVTIGGGATGGGVTIGGGGGGIGTGGGSGGGGLIGGIVPKLLP